MNKVDDRLHAAAEETRQMARQLPITRFVERTKTRHNGMLILASAFAVVIVMFGLIPWLISDSGGSVTTTPSPSGPVETVTTISTTMGTAPQEECSSQGVASPGEADGLPETVAGTRNAIIIAATACDFEALENLAIANFTTSYGDGGFENLMLWEDRGQRPMATLLLLLDMRYATIPLDDGEIHVWPAAATYESWYDTVTEEELDELSTIHSEGELDEFATAGAYLGWRTGIDEEGNWMYFVAGD
jgi:hypothetical protein